MNVMNGFVSNGYYMNPSQQILNNKLLDSSASISEDDKLKYVKYFQHLNPTNGLIDGLTAKNFFLKSELPTTVLANIWDLADINKDGMLDKSEFILAMHLITTKKLQQSSPHLNSNSNLKDVAQLNKKTTDTHESNNIINSFKDWVIPLQNRIRYSQTFKQHDINNSEILNGVQAKNILLQTNLPQNILAHIWNLSDINLDGALTLEEFMVAFFLAEEYKSGRLPKLPDMLPPDLIPPSYRLRNSISAIIPNNISPALIASQSTNIETPQKQIKPVTFEDKRRENFDKGAAILEQKREALLRVEAEERAERQRREAYDLESKKLITIEQEKKKQVDYDKMMEKQKDVERANDMEKIRNYRAKEDARLELEQKVKQDLVENKIHELTHLIKTEKELICTLKARQKDLDCDIQNTDEKISNMKQTRTETQNMCTKLTEAKDILFQQVESRESAVHQLLAKLQVLDSRLNTQIKDKTRAKDTLASYGFGSRENLLDEGLFNNKQSHVSSPGTMQFQTKLIDIDENEKRRLELYSSINKIKRKQSDSKSSSNVIKTNNGFGFDAFGDDFSNQLAAGSPLSKSTSLQEPSSNTINNYHFSPQRSSQTFTQLSTIPPPQPHLPLNLSKTIKNTLDSCISSPIRSPPTLQTASSPPLKTNIPFNLVVSGVDRLALTDSPKHSFTLKKTTNSPLASPSSKVPDADPFSTSTNHDDPFQTFGGDKDESEGDSPTKLHPYKALFPFEARSEDELSFNAGEIIMVAESEICEEGWLGGKIGEKIGWFPSAYADKISDDIIHSRNAISEPKGNKKRALALFTLDTKIDSDLSFLKGNVITIEDELDDNWWIGSLNSKKGYVPKSYVKIIEAEDGTNLTRNTVVNTNGRPLSSIGQAPTGLKSNPETYWSSSRSESGVADDKFYNQKSSVTGIPPSNNDPFFFDHANQTPGAHGVTKTCLSDTLAPTSSAKFTMASVQSPAFDSVFSSPRTKVEYVASFPFNSQEPGDLDLNVGDPIEIDVGLQNISGEDWWKGRNKVTGKTGIFPKNYVKPLNDSNLENGSTAPTNARMSLGNFSASTSENKNRSQSVTSVTSIASGKAGSAGTLFVAIAPFLATGPEQISLTPGVLVSLRRKTPAGWWEGEIVQSQQKVGKKQIGWFPGSHVKTYTEGQKRLSSTMDYGLEVGNNSPRAVTAIHLRAIFDYDANHQGDLSFKKGDLIKLTFKTDDNWWNGVNLTTNETGLFPSNYVSPTT